MDTSSSLVIAWRDIIEVMTVIVAALITVSSFDDFAVDLIYWIRRVTHPGEMTKAVDLEFLEARPQDPLAIMVPAWNEHDVILAMLTANQRLLAYKNYHIFVGAYQNDPLTQAEVQKAVNSFSNVHLVIVPRDGPTSKADCLNQIASTIIEFEKSNQTTFAGFILHDAEDLIHPHELALFNSLSDEFDFVQLPVFSFNRPLSDFVGALSMDEFAESHLKDIKVREALSGLVPCAGVAAYFGRASIAQLIAENEGRLFRTESLTEDYDVALRMSLQGARLAFIDAPVEYTIDTVGTTGEPQVIRRKLPIATREFFPSQFAMARRQRARWLLGIVFQGTTDFGWKGTTAIKYFLTRDRKSILTAPLIVAGYFVLLNLLLIELYFRQYLPDQSDVLLLLQTPLARALLWANFFFLIWRLAHRCYFTGRIYGLRQGLMSIPRLPLANFLNFFAVLRATRLYLAHRIYGSPLTWDKTAHEYPAAFHAASAAPTQISDV